MMITQQQVRAAKIAKADRIARMREAIRHLEAAITAYEQGDDDGSVPLPPGLDGVDVFVAAFEAPNGPISVAAAAAAIEEAAIGYPHERA